jgi:hypothetical protein
MREQESTAICPHCNTKMKKWTNPEGSTWGGGFQFVCFNDECPYFVQGWEWMDRNYAVRSSYRHRYNPATGEQGPIPVWSPCALRDGIIEEEAND